MIQNRLLALVAMAIPIGFTIDLALADARGSSLCSASDPQAVQAGATAGDCVAPARKTNAPAEQPVLHDDVAATTSVIPGPITRSEHFIYRLRRPATPSGETIVLLHGSGGDEASLFRLAARAAPGATLLGVRGRIVQKGMKRWYARLS